MPITTCPKCGTCYDERSEKEATNPYRSCPSCAAARDRDSIAEDVVGRLGDYLMSDVSDVDAMAKAIVETIKVHNHYVRSDLCKMVGIIAGTLISGGK